MKNKKSVAIVLLIAVLCVCLAFAACNEEPQDPTQLAAPEISLDSVTGTVSWKKVEHADSYDVKVNSNAAINVTTTSYTFPSDTAAGSYDVTVIAKSSDTKQFLASVSSNKVTYTVSVVMNTALEINTQNVKTVYYLDEGATEIDYRGLVVNARYSDGTVKALALSDVDVDDESVNLSVTGNKKIDLSYQEDNVTAIASFYIAVRVRSIDDVAYTERTVEHDANGKYDLGEYAAARTMDGVSVLNQDGTVSLPWGKTLVRLNDDFVLVTVAKSIATVDDFKAIADDLNGYYILTKDIDFENANQSVIGACPIDVTVPSQGGEKKTEISLTGGNDDGQIGIPFNGTLDGQGYTIHNYKIDADGSYGSATSRGIAMFGWLGEGGTIKNVSLSNVRMNGGGYVSLLVALNQGTIENICVQSTCSIFNNYSSQAAGAVAAYNCGTVNDVVNFVEKYDARNNAVLDLAVANDKEQGVSANVYCDKLNHTDVLNTNWKFFDGLGTMLTNSDWVYIANADTQMPLGTRWYLESRFMNGDAVTVSIYDDNGKADQFAVGWDGERHSHYVEWKDIATTTSVTGDVIKVVLHADNWKAQCVVSLTVAAAVTTGYVTVTQNIEVTEGLDLNLEDIQIRKNFSDGTSQIISPVKVEGFDKDGEVGAPQTVKAFYGDGDNDFVVIIVTLKAKAVESIAVSAQSSYKSEYQTDDTLDITGMKIDVTYNNQTSERIDVTQDMVVASSFDMSAAGTYNVEISYGGQKCTFEIVVRTKDVVIDSVEIVETTAKKDYKIGDVVALEDLGDAKLIARSQEGQNIEVAITLSMLSYDFSTAGNKQITVTYAEKTATINVTVVDFVSELVVTPTDTAHAVPQISYDIASTPDVKSAATYTVKYKSGAETPLTQDNVTATAATAGKQTVTYTYFCADGTFTVDVEYEIWAEIDSVADWVKMNKNLAGYYRLTDNLSFGGETYTATKSPYDLPHNGANYCMIGEPAIYKWPGNSASCNPTIMQDNPNYTDVHAEAVPFTGIFDGNGYYIHSLTIDGGSNSSNRGGMGLALFGTVGEGAKVGNFTLKNISVKPQNTAAFVAVVNFGTVENIVVESSCSITNKGNNEIAGVICYNATGATARNLVSYVEKMSKTKNGVVSEFAANCVVENRDGATAENCCVKGSAEFSALTADALGAGWTVIDNYGPVYGKYAVIVTECPASVSINGTFSFTFAMAEGVEGITVDARVPKTAGGTGSIYQTVTTQGNVATVTVVSVDKDSTMEMKVGETYTFRIRLGGTGLYNFSVTITE